KKNYPSSLIKKAQALCQQMTVVKDSLLAVEAGGVTSMHDATEGGVLGGLFEVATASGVGMEIDETKFIYPEEVEMVCSTFQIDPLTAIAEGSLLITINSSSTEKLIRKLDKSGIRASVVGKVTGDVKRRTIQRKDGSTVPLLIPQQDPFWPAFFRGIEEMQRDKQ
ncbi:AIR synthase, partial [bacterium]|nr:AIR synthase [bacterium]